MPPIFPRIVYSPFDFIYKEAMQTKILLLIAVVAAFAYARPRALTPPNDILLQLQKGNVFTAAPSGATLVKTIPPIPNLVDRLPDNATLIRANIVDTFRCDGRNYGYYGDVDNDCQVFHVCVPLKQIYPVNFTSDITYQFSFICPAHTVFTQDAKVCAWESEAIPCSESPALYWMNNNFFRIVEEFGKKRYAYVNEPLS
ncbi:hypothetical protein SK128_012654 [Halocaridina rubra]|uniref:Chitin-binding type-2 domain-containing protein n=1 Tax=Halocaridina rubra TaxID=373956 RepID=A0AAN8X5U3_HALRR